MCYNKLCKRKEEKKIGVESEIKNLKCPDCKGMLEPIGKKLVYECSNCDINSKTSPNNFSKHIQIDLFDPMGLDMILISPRHLFRMPYSLHEKTALASVVIDVGDLPDFQPRDADPLKIKIRNFLPNSRDGEANDLVVYSLDWYKENHPQELEVEKKIGDFKPVKIENISISIFPPSVQQILKGVTDGRKRALFILINLFRSIGMEKQQLEKEIFDWNKKNSTPLEEGYIKAQILWSYRNKIVPPPNFDKDYYKGIGVIPTDEELRYKNPVNYVVKKSLKPKSRKKNVP
ncbi:hypothetical protein HYT24_00595 [Candidatus Pacearchaeota archaeon]|nr:hypothetical protein [Candidatus Pacearchaeota archaeon]